VDATGLSVLHGIVRVFRKRGTHVLLSGVQDAPLRQMRRAGFLEVLGEDNVLPDIDAALARARTLTS
jgi:SulP family sulfate permease